jgi:hypothetical protein
MLKTVQTQPFLPWQNWSPILSTDLGDAATSFATTSVQLSRFTRVGNSVSVTVNFTAVLNLIAPTQLRVSMPPNCVPANNTTYSTASVYNNTAYETGMVRTVPSGINVFVVYRENFAAFTAGAPVEGRFTLTFEVA